MAMPEIVGNYLRHHHLSAEEHLHPVAYTSRQLAQVDQMPEEAVCKTVFFWADDQLVMGVLPANRNINLSLTRNQLKCKKIRLASERDILQHIDTLQLGAIPPFGSIFGLPVVMDRALQKNSMIEMPAGVQTESIRMSLQDYLREEAPQVLTLSRKPIRPRPIEERIRHRDLFL